MHIQSGGEQLKMKTFQHPKTHGVMSRGQMTGEEWGEETFQAMELPHSYAPLWGQTPAHKAGQAVSYQKLLLLVLMS